MSGPKIYKTKLLSLMDKTIAQGMEPQEIIELTMDAIFEKGLNSDFNYCCLTEILLTHFTRWYQNQHSPDLNDAEDEREFFCEHDCEEFEPPEAEEAGGQTIH